MGSLGTIGSVNAEFTASTTNFSAAMKEVGASLADTGAKAQAAGEKTAAGIRTMTTAAERARQAWERELVQQERAASAAAETARANELAALKADILSRADEVLARSANVTATAFERMAASVTNSMGQMGEKITAVAEKAELSADGIAAGFGGLGKLLGVGLLGDFVAHSLDNLAELNVKLGDLHEKTGISVQDLAGLRLAAQTKGLDFETISTGLTRLGKAMYDAKLGMQTAREAFGTLGISMKEVNTLSVEQMFYRISKAIGENRSLVVSDGTALELFSRGGKEVIPMLREWGAGLENVAKSQGAMTGITDESVRASQQWLQATTELTAEFHSALIPVLIDLVRLIEPVKVGFYALEIGVVEVFGTIVNSAVTVVESIGDIGKAIVELGKGHPGDALKDVKSVWTANQAGWKAQQDSIRQSALAGMTAFNKIGASNPVENSLAQNREGDVDGALLKQARQQLATMEQKKPLSHQQLIEFWKGILAKAQKGSTDYEQVNLVLGNLMQHPGNPNAGQSKIVQQWRQQLDEQKTTQDMTLGQEAQFWNQRAEFAKRGSQSYIEAIDQANKIIARMHAANATAEDLLGASAGGAPVSTDTVAESKERAESSAYLRNSGNQVDDSALREQGKAWADALKAMNEYIAAETQAKTSIAEGALQMQVATGQMSRLDAAQVQAALHTQEFNDAWERLQAAMAVAESLPAGAEKESRIYSLQAQSTQMQGQRTIQVLQDSQAINNQTVAGASHQALDQMVSDWQNMSQEIAGTLTRTVGSFNDDIAKLMTGQFERGQIGTMFGKTFLQAGEGLAKASVEKTESAVLGGLGFGGKVDGSSAAAALWVRIAGGIGATAGGSGVLSQVPGANTAAGVLGDLGHIPGVGQVTNGGGGSFFTRLLQGGGSTSGRASTDAPMLQVGPEPTDNTPEGAVTIPSVASEAASDISPITKFLTSAAMPALPAFVPSAVQGPTQAAASSAAKSIPSDIAAASAPLLNYLSTPSKAPSLLAPSSTSAGYLDAANAADSNGPIASAPDVQPKLSMTETKPQASIWDSILGDATQMAGKIGGQMLIQGFSGGGQVFGPGTGTSDSIPAKLSAGEFVTKAASTAKFLPLLHQINSGSVPGYADGGIVGGDLLYNRPAMVGPSPTAYTAASAGRIIPNDEIGSRSGDTHNWQIDARGATDPAETIKQFDRYMQKAAPQIAAAAIHGMKDQQMRRAQSAR